MADDDTFPMDDFRVGTGDGRVILQVAIADDVQSIRVAMTARQARELAADLIARAEGVERGRS